MSEEQNQAAMHEPGPTGEGTVILPLATARCERMAASATARGNVVDGERFAVVRADLIARAEMGKAKYGTYLRANNGRNAAMDLYQEVLDAIMYAEQCKYEAEQQKLEYTPTSLLVGAETLTELYLLASRLSFGSRAV